MYHAIHYMDPMGHGLVFRSIVWENYFVDAIFLNRQEEQRLKDAVVQVLVPGENECWDRWFIQG